MNDLDELVAAAVALGKTCKLKTPRQKHMHWVISRRSIESSLKFVFKGHRLKMVDQVYGEWTWIKKPNMRILREYIDASGSTLEQAAEALRLAVRGLHVEEFKKQLSEIKKITDDNERSN